MAEEYDVIVIGGGAMGTATARTLAERGRATLLLERFEIGNARGSSGGSTRSFRLSHDDLEDIRLARLALELWRELEDRAGETLLHTTGGVDVGPAVGDLAAAMTSAGVSSALVPPEAVAERWPALRPPDGEVLVQEDAGVIMAARTLRAQARLAAQAGATLVTGAAVERIEASGFGVQLDTAAAAYHAPIAVVAAGAWTPGLLARAGIHLPLVPTLEQVSHFTLEEPAAMPVVVDRTGDRRSSTYLVPDPEETGSFKVGMHHAGPAIDPDDRSAGPDPDRERSAVDYAAERLTPNRLEASETCLATNAPDDVFVLDRRGPLVIGSACSGHGFTYTPLVGRTLADLATAQPAPMPIERFLASRAALASA